MHGIPRNAFRQRLFADKGRHTCSHHHCTNCEKKIKSNIRFVKGTKQIETSVPNQTVTIVYDGRKTKYDDFVAAFKKIGYEIKKTK